MSNTHSKQVLESLYRISSLPGRTDDPHEALGVIIEEIMSLLKATSASINLLNPDTSALEIEVLRGLPEHSKQLQLSLGEGVTGWVALHARPLVVPDVSKEPRYYPVSSSIRSELAAPMIDRGIVIGVINVDSDQLNHFGEAERDLLVLLADEATRVVSGMWTAAQLRAKAEQLEDLVAVSRSLVGRLDLEELHKSIAEESLKLMRCRMTALFVWDEEAETLTLKSMAGARKIKSYSESLRPEESAIGTAIRRKKQVEVMDLRRTEEHHFLQVAQQEGLDSLLASPLIFEGEVLGVLCVYISNRRRFSNDEKNLAMALAGLAAMAIENVRLYKRVFESEEHLRRNERLTTLGLLSAEIAHEIRNPLTVIKLLFGGLDDRNESDEVRRRDREIIAEKLDQLEGIVTRVLSFGKSNEGLHSRWNLRLIVEDTLHLVRLKLQQSHVELKYQRPHAPLIIEGNKGQLQQALLNLLINATEAMQNGGVIEVRLEQEIVEGQEVAAVFVKDSGQGIDPRIKDRIFDSFLSGRSEGSGLGLNIVKRILKSHGGDVEIADTGPEGATMKIWIPLAPEVH